MHRISHQPGRFVKRTYGTNRTPKELGSSTDDRPNPGIHRVSEFTTECSRIFICSYRIIFHVCRSSRISYSCAGIATLLLPVFVAGFITKKSKSAQELKLIDLSLLSLFVISSAKQQLGKSKERAKRLGEKECVWSVSIPVRSQVVGPKIN